MTLTQENAQLVLGALESLTEHDHVWTEGERVIYEEACKLMGAKDGDDGSVASGNAAGAPLIPPKEAT